MKSRKDKNRGVRQADLNMDQMENAAPAPASDTEPEETPDASTEPEDFSGEDEASASVYSETEETGLAVKEDEEPAEQEEDAEDKKITLDDLTDIDPDLLTGKTDIVPDTKTKKARLRGISRKQVTKNEVPEVAISLEEDANEVSSTPDQDTGKKSRKRSLGLAFVVLASIAVLITVALTIFYEADIDEHLNSPLTVHGQAVRSDEFSFMYHYELINYGVDMFASGTGAMLDSPCEENPDFATYRDYFRDITAKDFQQMFILYDDATSKGLSIGQEHYERAQAYINWIKGNADDLGVSVDTYIHGVYGAQVDEQCVLNTLAKKYFTDDYASGAKLEELSATNEQAEEAYLADRNTYDLVSYKLFRFTYESRDEAFIKTAKLHAEEIISKMNRDTSKFEEIASKYFSGATAEAIAVENSQLVPDMRYEDISHKDFRDWLFDDARQSGDSVIFDDEDGFPIILVFVSRDRMMTPVRNVYQVTVYTQPEDDGSVNVTASQSLAQEIYDYITRESQVSEIENAYNDYVLSGALSVMHNEYSYLHEFDENIDNWIFSPDRKSGDKTIIDDGAGTFNVLYYVNESANPEWYDRVNSFIRMNNYQKFIDEQKEIYTFQFDESGLAEIRDIP